MSRIATATAQQTHHDTENTSKTLLGFWVYLMTDCLVFACLFATYAVLRNNTFGGPGASDLFSMPFVLTETMLLLTSSFTCGLTTLAARLGDRRQALTWLGITFLLGAAFLGMELQEFAHLISEGHSWRSSAFLSSFFALVGTHGLHIAIGLLWAVVLGIQIAKRGFKASTLRRLGLFSLFWHFLDIIWIFVFTMVYLMGVA